MTVDYRFKIGQLVFNSSGVYGEVVALKTDRLGNYVQIAPRKPADVDLTTVARYTWVREEELQA